MALSWVVSLTFPALNIDAQNGGGLAEASPSHSLLWNPSKATSRDLGSAHGEALYLQMAMTLSALKYHPGRPPLAFVSFAGGLHGKPSTWGLLISHVGITNCKIWRLSANLTSTFIHEHVAYAECYQCLVQRLAIGLVVGFG